MAGYALVGGGGWLERLCTYRSSRLVVVQIHLLAQIAAAFPGVDELPREFEAEANVVGAAAPLPVADPGGTGRRSPRLRRPRLVAVITGAGFDGAFAASSRHRVRYRCTGDGIDEPGFSTSCQRSTEGHRSVQDMKTKGNQAKTHTIATISRGK